MKHLFFVLIAAMAAFTATAQPVSRSLSMGAGYANQLWYSVEKGQTGSSPKNNWDIAFDLSTYGYSILANHSAGVVVSLYPNGDTADWATIDTAAIWNWSKSYNTDSSWAKGAFNVTADPGNSFDLGWGSYNMITHQLIGDRLFVLKLADGSYKKLWIEKMAAQTYTFRYANLDGSNSQSVQLQKAPYAGKNFVYYSLQNNAAVDREPVSTEWDLTFTQYYTPVQGVPYNVTGVLTNAGVKAYKATAVDTTSDLFDRQAFSSNISAIGYEWKAFTNMVWTLPDSTVYFLQTKGGDIWKIIFTSFGGSSTGNLTFTQEKLETASIGEAVTAATLALSPNPAQGAVTLLTDHQEPATAELLNPAGQTIRTCQITSGSGLTQTQLDLSGVPAGLYWVRIQTTSGILVRQLAVK